jgi:hypothetical protein
MKYSILIVVFIACFYQHVLAQNDIIEPMSSSSVTSLLSDDKVTSIRILASSDESLNIEIRYEGYNEEGKQYKATGAILDSRKQVIKEISTDPTELSRNASAVDLNFNVSASQAGSTPYLDSKYIVINIETRESNAEGDSDLFDDLSKLLGGSGDSGGLGGMMGNAYNFGYSKRWRIAGNENMVITATLTPIGKAAQ